MGLIMKIKKILLGLSVLCTSPTWAIDCYYTLAKDSCWTNYNVSVDVIDSETNSLLTTVTVPKGKQWTRQIFDCKPSQKLMYKARFDPIFWSGDKDKTYSAQRYWLLPDVVNPGDSAWDVSVCYPSDFSLVPLPPTATANCLCDFTLIPVIPPKQIK